MLKHLVYIMTLVTRQSRNHMVIYIKHINSLPNLKHLLSFDNRKKELTHSHSLNFPKKFKL